MITETKTNLPAHVEESFLRIAEMCSTHPETSGYPAEWGPKTVDTHHEEYPPGRCLDHRTLHNERCVNDNEYPFVYSYMAVYAYGRGDTRVYSRGDTKVISIKTAD